MRNLSHAVRVLTVVAVLLGAGALVLNVALAVARGGVSTEAGSTVPPARAKSRCAECGWISARQELASTGTPHAVRFQYTVDMTDGSARTFQESGAGRWRLGEPLMIIE